MKMTLLVNLLLCSLHAAAVAAISSPQQQQQQQQQQWPLGRFGIAAAVLPRSVQLDDGIWLHMVVSGDTLTIGVTASLPVDTAYLGIGLSEMGSMKGADVWMLTKTSSGSWKLVDAYAPGFVKPVEDAHQDLKLLGVESNANGSLTAAWSRFLAPCDLQDLPIIADTPIHVIWAHHNGLGYHGTKSRGGKLVNFMPAASINTSAVTSQKSGDGHMAQKQMLVAESGNSPSADQGLKTLDLVFPVTIPAKVTTYFVHYFKLPSDK
jgi:hypothetical protein